MLLLSAERLLDLWERCVDRHPIDRALCLFAFAEPELASDRLADAPLSQRNFALAKLRREVFGRFLRVWVDCPTCKQRLEAELDLADMAPPPNGFDPVLVNGHRFQRPTSRNLAELARQEAPEEAAERLLSACAESPDSLPEPGPRRTALLHDVENALDAADPWLEQSLAMCCPSCGNDCTASLDFPYLVWTELEGLARRLLDEVHIVASTYGWSEADILRMSTIRRQAYLERALA